MWTPSSLSSARSAFIPNDPDTSLPLLAPRRIRNSMHTFWLSFTDYNIAQPSNRGIVSSVIESSIHAIIYYTRLNKYKVPLATWSALTENLLFHIVGRSQVRHYPRRPTWRLYWYTTGMRTQVTAKLLSGLFGGSPDLAHKHSGISCKCRQVIFCGRPVTPFNLLCYCGHMFPHTCFLLAGIFS